MTNQKRTKENKMLEEGFNVRLLSLVITKIISIVISYNYSRLVFFSSKYVFLS